MTYEYNAISLLEIYRSSYMELVIDFLIRNHHASRQEKMECMGNLRIDAGYCLDAPDIMPGGGCQKFESFGRGHGADFAEQIEVQRP
jgi:hypothetical protein